MNLYIITGASKGIGLALKDILESSGDVIDISRNSENHPTDLMNAKEADIALDKVFKTINLENYRLVCLFNNAASIGPVGNLKTLSKSKILSTIQLNLTSPILLTSSLMNNLTTYKGQIKIANISSGVATNPLPDWAIYSCTKAALENFSRSTDLQLGDRGSCYTINPGIVDTNMQQEIREISANDFSEVDRFKSFKEQGHLQSPKSVARNILDQMKI
ncbi:MAG: SDR family NAD(P)-dependent oxidoreductase [Bdellovibrionales bacterium]